MTLNFHYHPDVQDVQDIPDGQDVPGFDDLPDLPPHAPQLRREEHWEPLPDMRPAREIKERLSAALSRTNTPLTRVEQQRLRVELNAVKDAPIDDDYPIPPILNEVESIPFRAKRGIRGNGGGRKKRTRALKRTLRKRLRKTLRKKRYF